MQPMIKAPKYAGSVLRDDVTLVSDPAPSLLSYRMQRLWLTPLFRALVRVGLPTFGIVGLGWMFLSQAENRDYLRGMVQEAQVSVQNQPVHQLQTLTIEGASPLLSEEIRAQFGNLFPISAFELDLEGMRGWIEKIPSVERAAVLTSVGGLLSVQVTEIQPEFIWRNVEGLHLISAKGDMLRRVPLRADYARLPLIAGEGAIASLREARGVLDTAAPISDRLRGLVRIGERRWDLVLLDGQTIALPEANPEQVLARVIVLSAAQDLFERDILLIDFRNPRRPTLRLRPQALAGLKQVKGVTFLEIAK
ncbi:cell division protein FtsQ/DivIB [uncultured Planktomarina sp.]|uniref:cell division protein FtsQ/DivIB n=1 Tax=uncultured Planktomarina sp. TaxID=1538529 RepID=UPI003261CAA1